MLTKLRYYKSDNVDLHQGLLNPGVLTEQLHHQISSLQDVREIKGGTLGMGFFGLQDGRRIFMKTHRVPASKALINKEYYLLSNAYPNLGAFRIETIDKGLIRHWLIMQALSLPSQPPSPMQVLKLIDEYQTALVLLPGYVDGDLIPNDWPELMKEAELSLSELANKKLISTNIAQQVDTALNPLRQQGMQLPSCLCHGDLGPANLLIQDSKLIAIDWEDAFWGVEGYDYLYWMTFMSNRKYLGPKIFGRTPLGKTLEISIMLIIILIKSEISRRSGLNIKNTLSFDDRLSEILQYA